MEVKKSLTLKQRLLAWIYPLLMNPGKSAKGKAQISLNKEKTIPFVPFYDLHGTLSNGNQYNFSDLKGKKVLIVNVASNCGYTNQYVELEKLQQQHKDKLVVLGFPSNDFKEQEPGTDEQIATFCKINFGVTFPLFKKHAVLKPQQNNIYAWLTDANMNGWNNQDPTWNFCKYLVDENGSLLNFFPSYISPLSKEVISVIEHGFITDE